MQVYNTTSNTWSVVLMPAGFGGSVSAVYIEKAIYFCGGVFSGATLTACMKYNMITKDFSSIASMPQGVNHAAFATDGDDKIFVLGGR